MNWASLLNRYWRTQLNSEDAEAWYEELTHPDNEQRIYGLSPRELESAIRFSPKWFVKKNAVGLADVRHMLLRYRAAHRQAESDDDVYLGRIRAEMRRRKGNPTQVWSLICSPELVKFAEFERHISVEESDELLRWAERELGFRKQDVPTPELTPAEERLGETWTE